jgi:hypothetical protein
MLVIGDCNCIVTSEVPSPLSTLLAWAKNVVARSDGRDFHRGSAGADLRTPGKRESDQLAGYAESTRNFCPCYHCFLYNRSERPGARNQIAVLKLASMNSLAFRSWIIGAAALAIIPPGCRSAKAMIWMLGTSSHLHGVSFESQIIF